MLTFASLILLSISSLHCAAASAGAVAAVASSVAAALPQVYSLSLNGIELSPEPSTAVFIAPQWTDHSHVTLGYKLHAMPQPQQLTVAIYLHSALIYNITMCAKDIQSQLPWPQQIRLMPLSLYTVVVTVAYYSKPSITFSQNRQNRQHGQHGQHSQHSQHSQNHPLNPHQADPNLLSSDTHALLSATNADQLLPAKDPYHILNRPSTINQHNTSTTDNLLTTTTTVKNYFRTTIDAWKAQWISVENVVPRNECDTMYGNVTTPRFRRAFTVSSKSSMASAVLSISGLGWYTVEINGKRVGNKELDPALSLYNRTVFFSSYDVLELLNNVGKENVVGVTLGRGWWNPVQVRREPFTGVVQLIKFLFVQDPPFRSF